MNNVFSLALPQQRFSKVGFFVSLFLLIISRKKGVGKSGKPVHFKGGTFHRIFPRFIIQGGDLKLGNGRGRISLWREVCWQEHHDIMHSWPRNTLRLVNYWLEYVHWMHHRFATWDYSLREVMYVCTEILKIDCQLWLLASIKAIYTT